MSSSKRKTERIIMKIRFWMMAILLLFSLSVFCFAIWHGVNNGYTSTTTIYGLIVVAMWFLAGFIGGPVLMKWIEWRKNTSAKALKRHNHIVETYGREEQG